MALTDCMEAIKALLNCVKADGSHVSHVILEEKQEAKLKKLTISELGHGMLLLDTDEGRKRKGSVVCMSPLFSDDGAYNHNCACDAVLLRQHGDEIHACYIEMKSDKPSGYEGQFKSTQCFIRYVADLAETFCGITIKINRERFVVFHTDSANASRRGIKPKTRFEPRSANTPKSPDMFCISNNATVRFSEFF